MSHCDALKERKSRREGGANWPLCPVFPKDRTKESRQTASLPYHFSEERLVMMRFNINVYPFGIGRRKKSDRLLWKIIGGAALAVAGAGVIKMLPDIKRYIRISTM